MVISATNFLGTKTLEQQYLNLLREVLRDGEPHADRTGVGTSRVFGRQIRHDLRTGFPLLTTKKMATKNMIRELMWFVSGSTNLKDLHEQVHPWWSPWARVDGDLGPIYGRQLRDARSFDANANQPRHMDQLANVLHQIIHQPDSRRILMTTWNAADVPHMQLPPCHGIAIQFMCHNDNGLSLSMYQRSADIFLGVPVNIASYALLLEMIAQVTGRYARDLVMTFGDLHLYDDHHHAAVTQLRRYRRMLPHITLTQPEGDSPLKRLESYTVDNFALSGYDPHPAIPAPLAV